MVDTKIFDLMFKNATLYEMKNFYLDYLKEQEKRLENELRKWEKKSMDLLLKYNGTSQIYWDTRSVLNSIYIEKKTVERKIKLLNETIIIDY